MTEPMTRLPTPQSGCVMFAPVLNVTAPSIAMLTYAPVAPFFSNRSTYCHRNRIGVPSRYASISTVYEE